MLDSAGADPAIESQLVLIATAVFDVIVSPEGGFQNITEWAKKEICWRQVQKLRIPLQRELATQLIERDYDRMQKEDAEAQQETVSGIQTQMIVLDLGPLYWKQLLAWAKARTLLSPDEESILAVACGMPRKLPTEKQSARLLKIKGKIELEGYSGQ